MVDPVTGKPSKAVNAIHYYTFLNRRKVDPRTGNPSDTKNAPTSSAVKNWEKPVELDLNKIEDLSDDILDQDTEDEAETVNKASYYSRHTFFVPSSPQTPPDAVTLMPSIKSTTGP